MDTLTVVLIVALVCNLGVTVWVLWRLSRRTDETNSRRIEDALRLIGAEIVNKQTESLLALRASLDSTGKLMNDRLAEGTSSLDRRMAVLGEIEHRLGQLATQATAIEGVGRNIQSLSELLRPPKLRGAVGEMLLDNLLAQILPQSLYHLQYRFESGGRVDAAVVVGERVVPIDAKFPLETYERLRQEPDNKQLQKEFTRSFRKHVDDISDKYIRPKEKTSEFALMYIPAEAVYYQLVAQNDQEGFEYALTHRVIPTCPGHLYAFLSSIVSLYSGLALAGSSAGDLTRQIVAGLGELAETTDRLARFHDRMDGSIRALLAAFDHAKREVGQAQQQLSTLQEPLNPAASRAGGPMPDPDHSQKEVE